MLSFPFAKINIALRVVEKRPDGYHSIETLFYPVFGLYDSLEWIESSKLTFESSGIAIDGTAESNLCVQAWKLLHQTFSIPPIHIFLQKRILIGAGLGGGSSDAAHMLKSLVSYYSLPVSSQELHAMALSLGSDCPFFLHAKPLVGQGRGDEFTDVSLSLQGYWLVLANPGIHINTAQAFQHIVPQKQAIGIQSIISQPISEWSLHLHNDFETSVFASYPQIASLKKDMYKHGALYAAMSGSGSTVFGIFEKPPLLPQNFPIVWQGFI